MARKRFNAEEKAVIAMGAGTPIEWRNGSHWHPAILRANEIRKSDGGWHSVLIENLATTRTIHSGQKIHAGAGSIRLPEQG